MRHNHDETPEFPSDPYILPEGTSWISGVVFFQLALFARSARFVHLSGTIGTHVRFFMRPHVRGSI